MSWTNPPQEETTITTEPEVPEIFIHVNTAVYLPLIEFIDSIRTELEEDFKRLLVTNDKSILIEKLNMSLTDFFTMVCEPIQPDPDTPVRFARCFVSSQAGFTEKPFEDLFPGFFSRSSRDTSVTKYRHLYLAFVKFMNHG